MALLLIVDDEPGIVEEIRSFFEEEGHRVHVADSGTEGIELIRRLKPDVLLLDMKLPDMSGLKVLENVKQVSPRTKTIVVTGYVDQGLFDEAERLGREAFLQKPFDLEVLKGEVDRLLGA